LTYISQEHDYSCFAELRITTNDEKSTCKDFDAQVSTRFRMSVWVKIIMRLGLLLVITCIYSLFMPMSNTLISSLTINGLCLYHI